MKSVIALAALLATCSPAPNSADVPPKLEVTEHVVGYTPPDVVRPRPRRVLIVGDSEACVVGRKAPGFARRYARDHEVPIDVIEVDCRVGTTVGHWSSGGMFERALQRHTKPDVVIVFLGTNDYLDKRPPDASRITGLVSALGVPCVWAGNTEVHGRQWPINDFLRASAYPCTYSDTEALHISLADGIHPGSVGADEWLQSLWLLLPR